MCLHGRSCLGHSFPGSCTKNECSNCVSLWHADDGSAIEHFQHDLGFFNRPREIGPSCGYFLEEMKSISLEKEKGTEKESKFCTENNLSFAIKYGSRHLGDFAGESAWKLVRLKTKSVQRSLALFETPFSNRAR